MKTLHIYFLSLLIATTTILASSSEENNVDADSFSTNPLAFDQWEISSSCPSLNDEEGNKRTMDLLANAMERNRDLLSRVPHWIVDRVYHRSIFQYGLAQNVTRVNNFVGEKPIIADLLAVLMELMAQRDQGAVRYLEIGVSFGKTFYLATNALDLVADPEKSVAVGFDAEDINPILVNALVGKTKEEELSSDEAIDAALPSFTTKVSEWSLSTNFVRRGLPGTKIQVERNNKDNNNNKHQKKTPVFYVAGDVLDFQSFKQIQSHSFNLVYSDAYHIGDILHVEFRNMIHSQTAHRQSLVIIWDDLETMMDTFQKICVELHELYPGGVCQSHDMFGWLGTQEERHTVGVFTTEDWFDLQCVFRKIATLQ